MAREKVITKEMIAEYEKITGIKIHLDKHLEGRGKNTYATTNPDGSTGEINLTQIPSRLNYYKQKALQTQIQKQGSIFKIEAPVKVKKQWKAISCSMTTDELAVIDKLMKDNNIKTYNKFIRLVLLKVIESNK